MKKHVKTILIFIAGVLILGSFVIFNPDEAEASIITVVDRQSTPRLTAKTIQAALDQARTNNGEVTVKLVAGQIYEIDRMLKIYGDTRLDLNGATIRRVGYTENIKNTPMLMTSTDAAGAKSGGYSRASNITITGGVWDSNSAGQNVVSNVMHFVHCQNIVIENTTIRNCGGTHVIIFDGVQNSLISKVTFQNCYAHESNQPKARFVNEAIHLDACTDSSAAGGGDPFDNTVTRNITVTGCIFDGVTTGVGAHKHSGKNLVQSDFVIKNNTFKKVEEGCVNGVATKGLQIKGNVSKKTGAKIFARLQGAQDIAISDNSVSGVRMLIWSYIDSVVGTATSGKVVNNTVSQSGGTLGSTEMALIQITGGKKLTFSGNQFKDLAYTAIRFNKTKNSLIKDNSFKRSNMSGGAVPYTIRILDGSNGNKIANNAIINNVGGGIDIWRSNKCIVKGNTIRPAYGKESIVTPESKKYSISGNKLQVNEGLKKDKDGKWRYYRNGAWYRAYNGLAKNKYGWFKCRNGVYDPKYTGIAKCRYGWFYVKKGKVNRSFTGLVRRPENRNWYYVKKGKLDWKFTGVARSVKNRKWYFARRGKLDWNYSGMAKDANGRRYIVRRGRAIRLK